MTSVAKKRSVEQPTGTQALWNDLWLAESPVTVGAQSRGEELKSRVLSDQLSYNRCWVALLLKKTCYMTTLLPIKSICYSVTCWEKLLVRGLLCYQKWKPLCHCLCICCLHYPQDSKNHNLFVWRLLTGTTGSNIPLTTLHSCLIFIRATILRKYLMGIICTDIAIAIWFAISEGLVIFWSLFHFCC